MKRQAGGVIELLIAFLILSVVVAYAMQITIVQMKSTTNNIEPSVSTVETAKSTISPNINQVQDFVIKIDMADELKLEEELQLINTQLR